MNRLIGIGIGNRLEIEDDITIRTSFEFGDGIEKLVYCKLVMLMGILLTWDD